MEEMQSVTLCYAVRQGKTRRDRAGQGKARQGKAYLYIERLYDFMEEQCGG
jgi:hypothetical protein